MNYVGIDIHKKYSVACVQDEKGQIIRRERIEGNRVEGFQRCLKRERSRAVIEASWNWAKIYEILEGLEGLEEVVLANPLRTRLMPMRCAGSSTGPGWLARSWRTSPPGSGVAAPRGAAQACSGEERPAMGGFLVEPRGAADRTVERRAGKPLLYPADDLNRGLFVGRRQNDHELVIDCPGEKIHFA